MLDEIYNSCYLEAERLTNWQRLNKNEIANLYLDNRRTENNSIYAAALLCKYWYKVGLIWRDNKNAMTQEDCYEIVWDGIEKAMDYAPWRDPNNSLYNDPNGPDKAINVCIESIRKNYYVFSNRDKRKSSHMSNVSSLDNLYSIAKDGVAELTEDYAVPSQETELYLNSLVDKFISKGRLSEAILLDTIMFNDCTVSDGIIVKFSIRLLVMTIHSLGDDFITYFSNQYKVPKNTIKECLEEINSLSFKKLHTLLNITLYLIEREMR